MAPSHARTSMSKEFKRTNSKKTLNETSRRTTTHIPQGPLKAPLALVHVLTLSFPLSFPLFSPQDRKVPQLRESTGNQSYAATKMKNQPLIVHLSFILAVSFPFLLDPPLVSAETEPTTPACSASDRAALLGFKSSILRDTTGILSTWVGDDCCGAWEGIQCDTRTGRVVVLQLQTHPDSTNFMKGVLSSSLGNLEFLQVILISGMKQIMGPIPENLSRLSFLTQLYLENNMLEGTIPSSLGKLTLLKALSLSGNRLAGVVPPELGNLKNLVQINLGKNLLTGGIPLTLGNIRGLDSLDLSSNRLSGNIPDFLAEVKSLKYIDLSDNKFSGSIPSSIGNLPYILSLNLNNNQLTGVLPLQIGNLRTLSILSVSQNLLTGTIPDSLSRLPNLWHLNLSRNEFSDPLPVSLAQGIPALLSIDLSYNNLHLGSVPGWIANRELRDVHLAGCKIEGPLPFLPNASSLISIDLSDNSLTGQIGNFFASKTSLQRAKLSNNKLESDISRVILPSELSVIEMHSNELYGSISGFLTNNTSYFLESVNLSWNRIAGTIPEFVQGSNLRLLDLSGNRISGTIPNSISNLANLQRLDISRNNIQGAIPASLCQLRRLEWLDVSINKLTGNIPDNLGILKHANFRSNFLCGQIPQKRPFCIFPAVAYAHNKCLCGAPLPPCMKRNLHR